MIRREGMNSLDFEILGNTIQSYLISLGIFILAILGAIFANRFLKKRIKI